ncbi:MAG: hypothetical protein H6996_03265 [Moraxellaceae bacterium]|nr:hypothetical protein [Pseudomonadales bacterium]MCP5174109.1 hypothetical protein [Moraxellaceae bacterium]MCP5176305.1 hypothetical protein [Moraxellaceae bacterium]HQV22171.1 hypothetical protein [Agitococcus sp.]
MINWQALKAHKTETPLLLLDLLVICLISFNLLWLLTDTVVMETGFGILLEQYSPQLTQGYKTDWHPHLRLYDAFFTLFLLTELGLRWLWAIHKKTYHRWFFYPFIHWYDVLACLPNLQFLRLLRLVSVFYRLHKFGIIVVGTRLVKLAQKYYAIILEEISDRIVINVLDGVQKELANNTPIAAELRDSVLIPHKAVISQWLANRISLLIKISHQKHEQELNTYIHQLTHHSIHHNPQWNSIKKRLPLVGNLIEDELHTVVASLVNDIAQQVLSDLSQQNNEALHDVADAAFETFTSSDAQLSQAIEQIIADSIEIIKRQVAVQQWKIEEQKEKVQK